MNQIIEYIANSPNPIFLPYLIKTFYPQYNQISKKAFEMRIRRLLKRLEKEDMIELSKVDGLIQIKPKKKLVYLIIKARKSFTKSVTLPKRISIERLLAIKEAQKVDYFRDYDDSSKVLQLFQSYIDRIESQKIILLPKPEYENVLFPKILPYRTRFNDKYMKRKNLRKYNRLFAYASKHFRYAVFLTLTTNPHIFKNLYASYKASYWAFNRFRYYLRKWAGKKPYILIHEFTKSGLLHFHIVIFDVKRLEDVYKISQKWEEVGLGKIVYVYALRNKNGQFMWLKDKPKGVKSKDIQTYLSKYLKKALYSDNQLYLYWLSGKRFFTHSKDFPQEVEEKKGFVSYYFYYGSFSLFDIPYWLYSIAIDYG